MARWVLPTPWEAVTTAQNGAKIRWFLDDFLCGVSDASNGLLEDAIADLAHLMQDGFEFAMICNRRFVEGKFCIRIYTQKWGALAFCPRHPAGA